MKFLRFLLFPFSILYGCLIFIRNKLYDYKILKSKEFNLPVIVVGNLSTGGTGKTPHIEYLIRLLKTEFSIATLSRGYGRKTNGFILSEIDTTAETIGDEPLQFKTKFPDIVVAVDEKRVNGITRICEIKPETNLILLDDAFQHRAVKAGLSIVLTDYNKLFYNDYLLPTGNLREFANGIKRADCIVVTKSPLTLTKKTKVEIRNKINALPDQQVYFSFIKYGEIASVNEEFKEAMHPDETDLLLITGIADFSPLELYLKNSYKSVRTIYFPDHHHFTQNEVHSILKIFTTIAGKNKILLTTEKDWMRLKSTKFKAILKPHPFYYLPIEVDFFADDKTKFDTQLLEYARTNTRNSKVHKK